MTDDIAELPDLSDPSLFEGPECCGTCDAFVPLRAGVGRCIAKSPQAVIAEYEARPMPDGHGGVVVLHKARMIDGAFPLTTPALRCRDDYRRKPKIAALTFDTQTEGAKQ